ncbi:stress enhanced protein 1, chloroplastic-like [Zingiber officinale]|uniref:stress enhanced protein 1, chloroplastic-like n=1 Tax=Zingiber officinale TaxID=94328 RepID=UPI001C4CA0E5|nr:stress enhanced protein 1, chloroplastic-like [Zingiber officinale]XP_042452093.1 stress enhanced protein 1, chloroplastic-like [Zingiber officinale]
MAAAGAPALLTVVSHHLFSVPRASISKSCSLTRFSSSGASPLTSSFTPGLATAFWITSNRRKINEQEKSISIRCEQRTKENTGLNVWLGRFAMVGFATAITVEISTGKGLLENFGFTAPIPTLALAATALVGVLSAFFIFQSASRD